MRKETVVALEITDSWLKLLHLNTGRSPQGIHYCGFKKIDGLNESDVSPVLVKLLAEAKTPRQHMIVLIPRRHATLSHFQLPTIDDAEIEQMVSLQVVSSVPYSREDIVCDYLVLEKNPAGFTKVLAVALHRDVVQKYLKILNQAHCHPKILTISSIGLQQWFIYYRQKKQQIQASNILLINFDTKHSELCFFEEDKLVYSREINFGINDLGAGSNIESFLSQINLTFSNYKRSNMGKEIGAIFVVAEKRHGLEILIDRLKQEYPMIISLLGGVSDVPFTRQVSLPAVYKGGDVSLNPSLGVLLQPATHWLNLLPKEISATHKARQHTKEWVLSVILGVFLLVVFGLIVNSKSFASRHAIEELNKNRENIKNELMLAQKKMNRYQLIKKQLKDRVLIVDLLSEIHALAVSGISLQLIEMDEEGVILIEGWASLGTSVSDFQENLVRSTIFKNVSLKFANKKASAEGESTHFSLSCVVKSPKDNS